MEKDNRSHAAKEALENAIVLAVHCKNGYTGSEHLLFGILSCGSSTGRTVLNRRGLFAEDVRKAVCESAVRLEGNAAPPPFSPKLKRILARAEELRSEDGAAKVLGTEHYLFAILEEENCAALRVIGGAGICVRDLLDDLSVYLPVVRSFAYADVKKDRAHPALDKYAEDMNRSAAEGRYGRVIGREEECAGVLRILCRKTKNAPLLLGEPGVGKTAVVEETARILLDGSVPEELKRKRIYALDLTRLIAGAKYRGEFEDRLKRVIADAKDPDVILFIDEIHTLIGAGSAEGQADAANILKPPLARGEIRVIGATTDREYRKYLEKDKAFVRRFETVRIGEPTAQQTLGILRGVKGDYERFHRISIGDDALSAAVELSRKYLPERAFPDKALDLLDEAASEKKLRADQSFLTGDDVSRALVRRFGLTERTAPADREGLRAVLTRRLHGQNGAIEKAVSFFSNECAPEGKTRGVVGIRGKRGSGRTTFAKALSEALCGERAFLRLDLSEYSEKSGLSALIGSPPGYVGYGEGGVLTDHVRTHPFSCVCVAHFAAGSAEVRAFLKNVFEEGVARDGAGRTVSFANCLFVVIEEEDVGKRAIGFRETPRSRGEENRGESGIAFDLTLHTLLPDREALALTAFDFFTASESSRQGVRIDRSAARLLADLYGEGGYGDFISFISGLTKSACERKRKETDGRGETVLSAEDFDFYER